VGYPFYLACDIYTSSHLQGNKSSNIL